jgi:EAL domain-containing protein (putative c-di-GMP-specific phosphodiesterase class I)
VILRYDRIGVQIPSGDAEGVATQQAWALLVECGCDEAQGELLAPPIPARELTPWLTRHAAGAEL